MRKLIISLILTLNILFSFGQVKDKKCQKVISNFISLVKTGNKEKISNLILFPMQRQYPLQDVKTKQEFIQRYDEIFDVRLIKLIVKSNNVKDWSEMGWRGLMFLDGQIWLDKNGYIEAVNYQSKFEENRLRKLIKAEKKGLYQSIRNFEYPVFVLETSKFRIRIDQLKDFKFRYASWSINKKMSEKPDLILFNCETMDGGTYVDQSFVFSNKNYEYECWINSTGLVDAPQAYLKVSKDSKIILKQDAKEIRR